MATLYTDSDCIYLGQDERIGDELFAAKATVRILSDHVLVEFMEHGKRQLYPRLGIASIKPANIEWEEHHSADLQIKKSRAAIVCQFSAAKAGPDELKTPDGTVLCIGFQNKRQADLFATRLKENAPTERPQP